MVSTVYHGLRYRVCGRSREKCVLFQTYQKGNLETVHSHLDWATVLPQSYVNTPSLCVMVPSEETCII